MAIQRKNPYGPIDPAALDRFERDLPAPLPADFRAFLLEFNGGEFLETPEFAEVPGGTTLGDVFGLHGGPTYLRLDEMRAGMKPYVPEDLLVFAADPYGNYFGMSLLSDDQGTVYFIDHENLAAPRSSLVRVAGSFRELVDRAGGDDVAARVPAADVTGAIADRDAERLRKLLSSGHSAPGHVHRAVASGSLEILRIVLETSGDPNELGAIQGNETPLFVAARNNRADMAQLLIDHGADPNARCPDGTTPLDMATHCESVRRVLALAGARPTRPS